MTKKEKYAVFTLDVSGEKWGWRDGRAGIHMISPDGEEHIVPKKEYMAYDRGKGYPDNHFPDENAEIVRPLTIRMYIEENLMHS